MLALAIIASCNVAHADSIRFGGWSKHFGSEYKFNETHNAVRYEYDKYGIAAGYFYNSYYDDSFFGAKQWTISLDRHLDLKVNLGVVHGYRSCNFTHSEEGKRWCVWFPPELRFKTVSGRPGLIWFGNGLALDVGFKW